MKIYRYVDIYYLPLTPMLSYEFYLNLHRTLKKATDKVRRGLLPISKNDYDNSDLIRLLQIYVPNSIPTYQTEVVKMWQYYADQMSSVEKILEGWPEHRI